MESYPGKGWKHSIASPPVLQTCFYLGPTKAQRGILCLPLRSRSCDRNPELACSLKLRWLKLRELSLREKQTALCCYQKLQAASEAVYIDVHSVCQERNFLCFCLCWECLSTEEAVPRGLTK